MGLVALVSSEAPLGTLLRPEGPPVTISFSHACARKIFPQRKDTLSREDPERMASVLSRAMAPSYNRRKTPALGVRRCAKD